MKLFKCEGFRIVISEEAFALKPFRKIWERDKSDSKDKAIAELGYIYFFCDPRSDYQYLVDPEERKQAIKEGEGLKDQWEPDKVVQEAMDFYEGFKPAAALLLEDVRYMLYKYRAKLRSLDLEGMEVKDLKDVGALIKQIPSLVKEVDDAEKTLAAEMKETGRMRGQGEKTIFEDSLDG